MNEKHDSGRARKKPNYRPDNRIANGERKVKKSWMGWRQDAVTEVPPGPPDDKRRLDDAGSHVDLVKTADVGAKKRQRKRSAP